MKIKTQLKIVNWVNAIYYLVITLVLLGVGSYAIYSAMYEFEIHTPKYDIAIYMGSFTIFLGLLMALFVFPKFIHFIQNQ